MEIKLDSNRFKFVGSIILIAIVVALNFFNKFHQKENALQWDFKGPVEKVWYSDKHYPTVVVNNKVYDLYYTTWKFDVEILKGDTIIKNKGDLRIRLIRSNSKDTLYFNSID